MRLKRYTADTMPEAIRLIKTELGPDAVILSTRKIKKPNGSFGLEITAAMENTPTSALVEERISKLSLEDSFPAVREEKQRPELRPLSPADALPRPDYALPPNRRRSTSKPQNTGMAQTLENQGVAEEFCKKISKAADALEETGFTASDALEMVLGKMIKFQPPAKAIAPKQIHIFIGPNGAGKTTTVAKLAVQKRMSGAKVALISLDFQKVSGYDQLATFAGAMGEKAYLVRSPEDANNISNIIESSDYIFVDTPGINPLKDKQISTLYQRLESYNWDANVHIVLPASMDSQILNLCPQQFDVFEPKSVIFTKVDETLRWGNLVNITASNNLNLCYVTDGAQVPDDLLEIDAQTLAQKLGERS